MPIEPLGERPLSFRTLSIDTIADRGGLIYNPVMTQKPKARINPSSVERDPRIFSWFLTFILVVMYVLAITRNATLLDPKRFILFTLLMGIHIYLHWQIYTLVVHRTTTLLYLAVQGVLAFSICWMAGLEIIVMALFLGLLGESVGLLGLTLSGLFAGVYFTGLGFVSILQIMTVPSAFYGLVSLIPVLIFTVAYVILYQRQAEAREQAQTLAAELESANRQLSAYAAQVEDLTISNERQRMARELHDTLSQGLAGIILQLEAIEAHLASNRPEKAASILTSTKVQARNTLASARNAIDNLRASSAVNLEAALRLEISRFTNTTKIPCSLSANLPPVIGESIVDALSRTAAEALTNITRHARANKVSITAVAEDNHFKLVVEDDGQGFIPNDIPSGHYGLLGIQERVHLLNGQLEVQSQPGEGTRVIVNIPQ